MSPLFLAFILKYLFEFNGAHVFTVDHTVCLAIDKTPYMLNVACTVYHQKVYDLRKCNEYS
jgi:hypothetical protein